MITHLYAGSSSKWLGKAAVKTACGLTKPFILDQLPQDVSARVGPVTCAACLEVVEIRDRQARHKALKDQFDAGEGKKAQ